MTIRGTIRGKTIDLESSTDLVDGQTVEVTVRAVPVLPPPSGRSAAGAWADLPGVDEVIRVIESIREDARFRDEPL